MQKLFNFCPNCTSKNHFVEANKFKCLDCNYIYFHNTAGAVAVFIKVGDEILFTKRNQNPKIGLLDLSGGFVDYFESAEQTVIREIYEELQIDVSQEIINYLGSNPNQYEYKSVNYHTIDLFFEIILTKKPFINLEKNEIESVSWLKLTDVNLEEIAFESLKEFIKKLRHEI